jgi:hypothetical protein
MNTQTHPIEESSLAAWVDYRAKSKHGPLSQAGLTRVKARLAHWDAPDQARAVTHSIGMGYQGIFHPDGSKNPVAPSKAANDNTYLGATMERWGRIYRTQVTRQMVDDYRLELKGLTDADLERAAAALSKSAKFFPRPSEIWQAAKTEGWL